MILRFVFLTASSTSFVGICSAMTIPSPYLRFSARTLANVSAACSLGGRRLLGARGRLRTRQQPVRVLDHRHVLELRRGAPLRLVVLGDRVERQRDYQRLLVPVAERLDAR
jgi:hypothetical protein